MNEQPAPDIAEVDTLLREAADAFSYPRTPSMAAAVLERLGEPTRERRFLGARRLIGALAAWRGPVPRIALAVIAGVLLVLGAALAIPQSRTALAELFGLGRVRVEIGPVQGPEPPVLSPASFARPVGLRTAQEAVDFTLRFPTRGGLILDPDAVYVQGEDIGAPVVIFLYQGEDFDLYQSGSGFFGKGLPDESFAHEIDMGGQPGFWIDQGGHIASFLDDEGRLVVESRRTVDRATLLWEEGGITYRLESSLSRDEAIRVAESLQ